MIVKINAFSFSIIFLQSALWRKLSITPFIHVPVAVVTVQNTLSTKFKIMKLKFDAFSSIYMNFKVHYQRIYELIFP